MKIISATLISLLLSLSLFSEEKSFKCLNEKFKVTISHKSWPLGLFDTILQIEKDGCLMGITHTQYKYLQNYWAIDVCRGPIHIKEGANSIDVLKKMGQCLNDSHQSKYCQTVHNIMLKVQDDGLIFAPGDKNELQSDHGKVYCSYLLLKNYLKNGVILNKNDELVNLSQKKTAHQDRDEEEEEEKKEPKKIEKKIDEQKEKKKNETKEIPMSF